ncbi:MAG TPA: hypothetical protein VFV50_14530 [Bdellovibrionales bacterium]|nr:hypothetical protein [Bdellovibrionales bacterium]
MFRRNLLAWQREGYTRYHQDRANIVIHILTVPLFWLGTGALVYAAAAADGQVALASVPLFLVPLIAQGLGHKRESVPPEPFLGGPDFVSRFVAEQFVTFPKWLFSRR